MLKSSIAFISTFFSACRWHHLIWVSINTFFKLTSNRFSLFHIHTWYVYDFTLIMHFLLKFVERMPTTFHSSILIGATNNVEVSSDEYFICKLLPITVIVSAKSIIIGNIWCEVNKKEEKEEEDIDRVINLFSSPFNFYSTFFMHR